MFAEIEEKTGRLVEMLCRENLGGVLLNAQHNFAWLTAGGNNGVDLSRENGVATVLVTDGGKRYILANRIEMPRLLAEQMTDDDLEPIDFAWQQEKEQPKLLVEIAGHLVQGPLASDLSSIAGTRNIEGLITACRASLTVDEAERYRELGRDASDAMNSVVRQLTPGESEVEIAEKMRTVFSQRLMTLVVALVAADERIERYRHPLPTETTWAKTLLLVACAKRSGLIVSLSRMISAGGVSDELRSGTEAAAFVNASLWHRTRPGVTGAELYQVAADAYRTAGFEDEIDKHHQGGAAGYRTRDWVAHPAAKEVVQLNQGFAWNPSITGTKVEETVISTDGEVEVITASADFPTIPVEIDGITYHSPGILSV